MKTMNLNYIKAHGYDKTMKTVPVNHQKRHGRFLVNETGGMASRLHT